MRITKPSKATKVGVWWIYHNHVYNSHIAPYDGKWLLFVDEKDVDEIWEKLVRASENKELSAKSMKVSTKWSRSHIPSWIRGTQPKGESKYVICVYTSLDMKDIMRVREELRTLGFTAPIPYKTNESTLKKIYGKGAAAFWA